MVDERKILSLIYEKRTEILRIASKYGASDVRIFGSVARGEENPESDVDLLVTLEPGRSLLDRASLMLELEKLLGVRVDVATEKSLKDRIRRQIIKNAIPV